MIQMPVVAASFFFSIAPLHIIEIMQHSQVERRSLVDESIYYCINII